MKNNINKVNISTGGANLRQDSDSNEVEPLGLAKASPSFKALDAKTPEDLEAERKAIASNTKLISD
jgi:hypothetical protein